MNLRITQSQDRPLSGPVKAQFLDERDGRLWRMAAGDTPGSWQAEAAVDQADTLSADIAMSAKSCTFTVPVPAGMAAAGNPRFVRLHVYNTGTTDAVGFAALADLVTGELFDPFYAGPLGGAPLATRLDH